MAAAVAAIVSRWETRENLKSGTLLTAIARCVGCAIPTPPQKPTERLGSCAAVGHAHRYHHRTPPWLAPPSPQVSDDWTESEVGLSWRRAAQLYPKQHGWDRGVVTAELDIRFQRIWSQTREPVIFHQGTGKPLLVRVPYAQDNRLWIRGDCAGTSQCGMPPGNGGRRRGRGSIGSSTRRWSATARSTSSSSIRNCRSVRRPAGTPRATTASAPAWAPTTAAGTLVAAGTRSLRPSPFNGGRHSSHVGTWYGRRQDVGRVLVLGLDTRPPPLRTRGPASRGTIAAQASHDRQRMGLR